MVLLSPKFLSYMKKGVTFGQKYCTHPFVWNKRRNEPELSTCKRRLFIWYFNVLVTVFYSGFLIVRNLQVNLDEEASNGKKIYMRFIIFFQAFPPVFQLTIYLKKDEFSKFFIMTSHFFQGLGAHNWNRTTDLELELERNLNSNDNEQGHEDEVVAGRISGELKMPKLFELFFDFIWYVFFLAGFGQMFLTVVRPDAADKISSVFLNDQNSLSVRILILVFCSIFQLYYAFMYIGNGFLWIFTGFSLFFPELVVLRKIKNDLSPSTTRSRSFTKGKVKRILDVYKLMEVLMKYFHELFCTLIIPASKIILMSLTIVCTYGAIKMQGFLAVFLAVVGILAFNILIAIFASMAWLHTYSEEILFLMKAPRFQRHLDITGRKYVEALTLIQLKMGSSYIVDKECVITMLQIVVDSTVDFLLANA